MSVFFRICREKHAQTAFDGEGARRHAGRWNHSGVPMAYCASSLALATLEMFVHTEPNDVPSDLVSIRAELPDDVAVELLDRSTLPSDWRDYPAPLALRDLGTAWAVSLRTVALLVPSAIIPREHNVVVNPRHGDVARLVVSAPEPFAFDPRMFRSTAG